jgi:5'-methylthioadenosine nucleosidase
MCLIYTAHYPNTSYLARPPTLTRLYMHLTRAATTQGAAIGDVFLASNFAHHDRRIGIPGFTEYGVGSHEAHSAPLLAAHLACKVGSVTTSNSLDHNADDDKHMAANDAAVKDMEGAAIAWVAEQTATALLGVKVVTDIVDGDRATHEVHAHTHACTQCTTNPSIS